MNEQNLIDMLIESYSEMTTDTPSSLVLYSNDLKSTGTYLRRVCASNLCDSSAGMYDNLLLACNEYDCEIEKTYYDCLIGTIFKRWSEYIKVHQDPTSGLYYIRCTDLDKIPAKVLYNFAIASRGLFEHTESRLIYCKLAELGVPHTLAIILCRYCLDKTHKDPLSWRTPDMTDIYSLGHQFLGINSDWDLVMTGNPIIPDDFDENYKHYPGKSTPCNQIWGKSVTHKHYTNMTIRQLTEIYNK